ncbi:unnamed protein product [Effrenium voratum]|nr:unnamed protein product [Effrenium voratum]
MEEVDQLVGTTRATAPSFSRWRLVAISAAALGACCLGAARWLSAAPTQSEPQMPPSLATSKPALQVAREMGVEDMMEVLHVDTGRNRSKELQIDALHRQLQAIVADPLAVPIAACTIDVYLVATFIATLGNIINGAVKGCDRASTAHNVITADRFADIIRIDLFREDQRQKLLDLLDQACRIGIETSVALVSFIAAFLARAASDCAASVQQTPNLPANCAGDVALLPAAISFLAASAETVQATCTNIGTKVEIDADVTAIDISSAFARRLSTPGQIAKDAKVDQARQIILQRLPSLGPVGGFIWDNKEWLKIKRHIKKGNARRDQLVKCGFDIASLVGFTAATGLFVTAGTLECPAAEKLDNENFKMGCSLDISAVVAALTTIAGYIGILATECPEEPNKPAVNLCVTGSFNIVASVSYLAAAFSEVKRSCAPTPAETQEPLAAEDAEAAQAVR